jgi:hypothetical protein
VKIQHLLPLLLLTTPAIAGMGPGPWAQGAYYPGQYDGRYSANVYNNTQARFDAGQMHTPSGNTVREDAFVVTTNTTFQTNITSQTTVTDISGLPVTNTVTTTNITSATVITTNLVTSGAAAVVSGVLGFGIRSGTPATGAELASRASGGDASTAVRSIGLDTSLNYFVIYVDGEVFAGQTAAGINNNTGSVAGSLFGGVGRNEYRLITNTTRNTNGFVTGSTVEILQFPSASASGYFNARIKNNKTPFVFKGAGEISARGTTQAGTLGNATYPFNVDGIKSSDNSASGYTTQSTGAL